MAKSPKKSKSRLWFLVHSWLALPIWFFVLIVCFTGMLAVVSQEIVWLADPAVRANKPDADTERMSFQQVLEALNKAEPDMVVERLSQPDGSHFAVKASVTLPDGTSPTLYVNASVSGGTGEGTSWANALASLTNPERLAPVAQFLRPARCICQNK